MVPTVVIDAIMAKRNLGTQKSDAPIVIGLGPGFTAGVDCHAVIETMRGHDLGRVIWSGSAHADTGQPGELPGIGVKRSSCPACSRRRSCQRCTIDRRKGG